ncbi:DUF4168 domain-containing protein [Cyanobacterium aponinum UTEX 3222]|uniref:DUF4168 domain-containing protein n=2 Tax=Cyanobacterium aponinum TaxID=379064 RepID=K9Z8T0_CYAAP|nr:DUF4168 domain-containing protein [Cyanobacterium aponinum]WRL43255.1 DUF4168 domain-containing protein [Cyanobacterium aponinum UTEX 3222]AFZ54763.1 hypothetical protein Cyan10605_2690 [Cyanobacterium aponinum PCC 10605]MBD2392652.1 DUF4168 domain-containing protein [Cyanobacterium aponinum FACHB-4101]PHV64028.1 DUF4168 domain-containing protein [Cyanobacterium aponinum IPPAS B-1201]WPF87860.1 DUF4168 domain-containing protein [Cyanobacterium aponinum AL20115]
MKVGSQFFLVCGLAVFGVSLGIVPEYNQGSISIESKAMAQNVSDEDLKKYAQAAIEIENLRKTTYSNIEGIVGKSMGQMSCNQRQSFSQLPDNARNMAIEYCDQSETIVKNHGLSVNRFNQITQQVKQNPSLKQRLQSIIGQM